MEPELDNNQPIFIVGAPRSGTTLLAAMLANHSRITCGAETQFFSKLKIADLEDAVKDCCWPEKAIELLTSLTLSHQKVYELFGLSLDKLHQYLGTHQPSIRAMLEALTELYAQQKGKPRWAEKTPNHLLHLSTIRQIFPLAPIIRIIRDPRDAALSMRKLPWASDSILANCYLWDEWFHHSCQFFSQDKNSLTVRYEDLLANPQKVLSLICEHIGEKFEVAMLDTAVSGRNVISPNEQWKSQVAQPLDLSRTYVWKRELSRRLWSVASHICYSGIETFGYELASKPKRTFFAYQLDRAFVENNGELIISAARSHIRIAPVMNQKSILKDELMSGDLVLFSLPQMGSTKTERIANICRLIIKLLQRYILGNPINYVRSYTSSETTTGITEKICIISLQLLGNDLEELIVKPH